MKASGKPARRRSINDNLTTFVALVTVAFAALVAWNSWRAHQVKLEETGISASNMSQAMAQHAQDAIEGVDNILAGLVHDLEQRPLNDAAIGEMAQFLRSRVAERAVLHGLFFYDKDGRWIVNSQLSPPKNLNNADREYFRFHQKFADKGPYIGPPIKSRSTGDWILTVSRRVDDANGAFAGVVLATLNMSHFREFYDRFEILERGVIFLSGEQGTLLVRKPFDPKVIGLDISKGPIFTEFRTHGAPGTAVLTSKIDQTERIYSYRRLEGFPVVVAVGLATGDVLASWRTSTLQLVVASVVIILGLLWLGMRLSRQIAVRETARAELKIAKADLERSNEKLAKMALLDGLTGIANRRQFDNALEVEYARARRNGESISLAMVDVDHFKQYNDVYGHPQGDACLQAIAKALSSVTGRPADLVARYGGEEFAVLLPATKANGAHLVAEKLRLAVAHLQIAHAFNAGGVVTVSVGVATWIPPRVSETAADLLHTADAALYVSKGAGRNRVSTLPVVAGNAVESLPASLP